MHNSLNEITELESILEQLPKQARVRTLGIVTAKEQSFPLYSVSFGSQDPSAPTLGLFAGVHGLERIGSKVVIAYLNTISQLIRWDDSLLHKLEKTRLVFFPIINPIGMFFRTRSNGNGVDLMRNAPIEADKVNPLFLAAGHRISPKLPWYRGNENLPMEAEALAVCQIVREEIFTSSVSIALDVHSGYGTVDRLWFPYAKTLRPFKNLPEIYALNRLLDDTYPNHIYRLEPQAKEYTTHGDLWDYLYDEYIQQMPTNKIFMPLALELGSWVWVKKNPKQVFNLLGAFNPLLPHRRKRTLRRHITLLEFLHKAVLSSKSWATLDASLKEQYTEEAMKKWYSKAS